MELKDVILRITVNYFSGFVILIWGIIRLIRISRKDFKITNKVIQPDLNALFSSIMMVVFGIVVLVGKITGKI